MADEPNTPNHRYYKPENNIPLPANEISPTLILDAAIVKIDAHIAALAASRA
jgi:hypothetical protein